MKGEFPMSRRNLFWGFMLVFIGVLFLLSTSGLIKGIDPWSLIWPAFLIGLGLWILFGNLLARRSAGDTQQINLLLEGAASARVKINHGAGRLTLDSRASPGEMLSGSFVGGVQYKVDRSGSEVRVKLRVPDNAFPFINWGWSHSLDWTIGLNREIPIALEVGSGANESKLDLTDLRVTELQVHTGASATDISLPANAGYTRVSCEGGVAGLELRVPTNVAARIHYRGGLSSVNVSTSRFPPSGDGYQSVDYDTAANKVDIDVHMGIGSVNIR
jgi:hypothetical protein